MQSAEQLWLFACETYRNDELAGLLLNLQDQYDCNINILLCIAWLSSLQLAIKPAMVQSMQAAISEADERIIKPLRLVRRHIKEMALPQSLYKQAKTVELACEKHIIEQLFATCKANKFLTSASSSCYEDLISINMECYFCLNTLIPDHKRQSLMEKLRASKP